MNDEEVFMDDVARVYDFAIKRESFLIEMLQRECQNISLGWSRLITIFHFYQKKLIQI